MYQNKDKVCVPNLTDEASFKAVEQAFSFKIESSFTISDLKKMIRSHRRLLGTVRCLQGLENTKLDTIVNDLTDWSLRRGVFFTETPVLTNRYEDFRFPTVFVNNPLKNISYHVQFIFQTNIVDLDLGDTKVQFRLSHPELAFREALWKDISTLKNVKDENISHKILQAIGFGIRNGGHDTVGHFEIPLGAPIGNSHYIIPQPFLSQFGLKDIINPSELELGLIALHSYSLQKYLDTNIKKRLGLMKATQKIIDILDSVHESASSELIEIIASLALLYVPQLNKDDQSNIETMWNQKLSHKLPFEQLKNTHKGIDPFGQRYNSSRFGILTAAQMRGTDLSPTGSYMQDLLSMASAAYQAMIIEQKDLTVFTTSSSR